MRIRCLVALVDWQITGCGSEQLPGEAMESQTEEGSFKPSTRYTETGPEYTLSSPESGGLASLTSHLWEKKNGKKDMMFGFNSLLDIT